MVTGLNRIGTRIAIISMVLSAGLAVTKIYFGRAANSTSVVSDGIESAGDVLASGIVFFGLLLAAKPPDAEHPYGHGRYETLAGLGVGVILAVTGAVICLRSLQRAYETETSPAMYAIWPLLGSILVKSATSAVKFHYGKKMRSAALTADAWHDGVDICSGITASIAVALSLYDPRRFFAADHLGGFLVGLIVIFLGARVIWETAMQLMDTMPDRDTMAQIRKVALSVPGAIAIEKCYARKTGMQFHVDLHLEVAPDLTVRESHNIATEVRNRIRHELAWVADVLVHVEPACVVRI